MQLTIWLAFFSFFANYSGHDPSRLFHRSVNKRNVPDYYDIIKEPMALSILKQRINKRDYKKFTDFVRDCALVCLAVV
jgi:chromatin structure-remodeling complex subunit RSC1/2